MEDDGPLGVRHAGAEPRHREVGRRAPQQRAGVDRRLDLPVAGGLRLGVLDDRLHHRGARPQRRGEIVVRGEPRQNPVDGRKLHGADLGEG
jgi:hypothetical protein